MPHHLDCLAEQDAPLANRQDWECSASWSEELPRQAVPVTRSRARVGPRKQASAAVIRCVDAVAEVIGFSLSVRLLHMSD